MDQIAHNLKKFPFSSSGGGNVETDTFYRTTVAQFVLREFQAAWTVVPTTGATSQFNNWVARALADPTVLDGTNPATSMSFALASTPQFAAVYNIGPNDLATTDFINTLWANMGNSGPANPGLLKNAEVTPVWQVLQAVVTNGNVIRSMAPAVANFQDLLLNGGSVPGGWIPTRSATPSTALVPQRKVGFPISNAGLLLGFQGTKTARRERISSPFSDAGGCTSPQNSGPYDNFHVT
jgi:hypothetical protein